jgi:DUF1680 family protein
MNIAYHEAKYADLYEESMYNALLGSVDLEARNFYYQNPLDSRGPRYPWHACPCCVGNIPRTLLMIPTWTYVKGDDGLYVNLFIGGTINVEKVAGTDVQMVQKTDYPWSGKVSITVNPETPKRFKIYVRMPNRTTSELYTSTPEVKGLQSITMAASSTPQSFTADRGYTVFDREWKAGDRIELVLPMEIQRIKASEKIAATKGQVALRYGPLIYCVEAADQELGKTLSPDASLTTEWKGDLLGGVTVIKGTWADGSPLTAIPYYARDNRIPERQDTEGEGGSRSRGRRGINSSVWIKDQ